MAAIPNVHILWNIYEIPLLTAKLSSVGKLIRTGLALYWITNYQPLAIDIGQLWYTVGEEK